MHEVRITKGKDDGFVQVEYAKVHREAPTLDAWSAGQPGLCKANLDGCGGADPLTLQVCWPDVSTGATHECTGARFILMHVAANRPIAPGDALGVDELVRGLEEPAYMSQLVPTNTFPYSRSTRVAGRDRNVASSARCIDLDKRDQIMDHPIGLTEACGALEEYFGSRLEARRDEGLTLMADALRDRFGISNPQARQILRALEVAHSIRWIESEGATVPVRTEDVVSTGGYWQL